MSNQTDKVKAIDPNGKEMPVTDVSGNPLRYNSGLVNIVPIEYVLDLMKKNGVTVSH